MDREAWQATFHGVTTVGHGLVTKPPFWKVSGSGCVEKLPWGTWKHLVSHWLSSRGNPCPCVWERGQAKEATDGEGKERQTGEEKERKRLCGLNQNPDFSDSVAKRQHPRAERKPDQLQ